MACASGDGDRPVMWERLDAPARRVMVAALDAADELGHGYIGDEHILLGLWGDNAGPAHRFLERHGLSLAAARTELLRLTAERGVPQLRRDQAADLRAVGIDVERVAHQLTAAFGPDALSRAVCRASHRPWWRGGGRLRTPLSGKPLAAKRALALAATTPTATDEQRSLPSTCCRRRHPGRIWTRSNRLRAELNIDTDPT